MYTHVCIPVYPSIYTVYVYASTQEKYIVGSESSQQALRTLLPQGMMSTRKVPQPRILAQTRQGLSLWCGVCSVLLPGVVIVQQQLRLRLLASEARPRKAGVHEESNEALGGRGLGFSDVVSHSGFL